MWLGAPDAEYSPIASSDLDPPPQGWALDRVQVTAGQYVTIATGFVRGKKHKPILAKEEDYILRLLELRRTSFVFCDVHTHKAWLVNGLSTLLHLVRSHLVYAENDELHQSVLTVKANDFKAEGGRSGLKAAFDTLRCHSNRALQLHHKGVSAPSGKAERASENHYSLEDLIKSILHILEQIVDHQSDFRFEQASVGYRIKASPWERLEGFDFMDVAVGRRKVSSKAMKLFADGRGWAQLTRALEAPTLFGKRFGEMLEPADTDQDSSGCRVCHWNHKMPAGRDLLAVQMEDLLKVGKIDGNRLSLPDGLCLDIPPVLFEPCTTGCQDHDRIQSLQPYSENAQPLSPLDSHASLGFLTKAFLRMKMVGGDLKGENEETQLSSPTEIPSEGAVLLGMPRESRESYSHTLRRHVKRPLGGSAQTFSNNDNPQVASSSSRSNDATTSSLGNSRAQTESTSPTQLSDQQNLSNSIRNLYDLQESATASLQPTQMDSHRRKRAARRAKEGKTRRQKGWMTFHTTRHPPLGNCSTEG